jgi:hypothetical protein
LFGFSSSSLSSSELVNLGVETAGDARLIRFCCSCLTRSRGSRLPCLEGTEAGVLDLRGKGSFRGAPLETGLRKAGDRDDESDS